MRLAPNLVVGADDIGRLYPSLFLVTTTSEYSTNRARQHVYIRPSLDIYAYLLCIPNIRPVAVSVSERVRNGLRLGEFQS